MIPLKKYRYIYKEREIERGAGLVPSGAPCCRRSERDGDEREKKKKDVGFLTLVSQRRSLAATPAETPLVSRAETVVQPRQQ